MLWKFKFVEISVCGILPWRCSCGDMVSETSRRPEESLTTVPMASNDFCRGSEQVHVWPAELSANTLQPGNRH